MELPSLRGRGFGVAAGRAYKKVIRQPLAYAGWQRDRLESALGGMMQAKHFAGVTTYCMFVGYPRSGHSLVGSLIDAHPEAVISHELDALRYICDGFSRSQLYYLILRNSRRMARAGRAWTGYSYVVPEQWQGKFSQVKVIGDKTGGYTARRLMSNYALLNALRTTVGIEIRLVHIVRNPWDNISTISRRQMMTLTEASKFFWELAETVAKIKAVNPEIPMLDMRHEDVIARPKESLTKIFEFLGLSVTKDFLQSCESILFEKPSKTSHAAEWSPELVDRVNDRIEEFPFFSGYEFGAAL